MGTTKRSQHPGSSLIHPLRPVFDLLETRRALSGMSISPFPPNNTNPFDAPANLSPLTVVSTSPTNSSTLTSSPTSLVVTFDEPLNGFSLGIADFALLHVNADGSTRPLASNEPQLNESLDLADPTGSRIALGLSSPLTSGQYELVLVGSSQLMGADGALPTDSGSDEVVAKFAISPPQTGLRTATNLATIGSTVVTTTGNLDLSGNPGAVNYARLTLGPGHRWRLGLSVDSKDLGSPLTTTLSLFDAQGKLVATSSTGLLNDPGDPFLFTGLDPGTYYVGISARGNVPQADGTYNPSGSFLSSLGNDPKGGVYQLEAVADIADQPTQVLGVRLDEGDPLSANPTGLTVQFSGPLQVTGLAYQAEPPLKLVDQAGVSWGVTTTGYDPATGQLQVVFDQALPAGSYTLELTGVSSLLDLAGAAPVAHGLAPGELATIPVGSQSTLTSGDLGPVFPVTGTSELVSTVSVGPRSSNRVQFVTLAPGVYAIEGIAASSGVSYVLTDASNHVVATGPRDSLIGDQTLVLGGGTYTLTLTNPTGQSINVPLTLVHKETVYSQLMDGGIAQGAALSLRLTTPQVDLGLASPPSTSMTLNSGGSIDATPSRSSTAETVTNATAGLLTANAPTVTNLLYGFGPVGLPSAQSNQISVVGPTGTNGALALASNSAGLSPGLIGIPESASLGSRSEPLLASPEAPPESDPGPPATRMTSIDTGLLARAPQSRRADELSLADADWISQIVANAVGWLGEIRSSADPTTEPVALAEGLATRPTSGSTPVGISDEPDVESASLTLPVGVSAAVIAASYRYRRNLNFRRFRLRMMSKDSRSSQRFAWPGPHRSRSQQPAR